MKSQRIWSVWLSLNVDMIRKLFFFWFHQAGSCVIAGVCYKDGANNPADECQVCDASKSDTSWSNDPGKSAQFSYACLWWGEARGWVICGDLFISEGNTERLGCRPWILRSGRLYFYGQIIGWLPPLSREILDPPL